MDIYKQTSLKIDFNNGIRISPIVVFDGVEMEGTETFHSSTHHVEELISYIEGWENSGCDVFI
jgi:hypothetical protein